MGSVASSIGSVAGGLGGITNGIAKGFTPQNEYQASNPLDQQAFMDAIKASQGNFNQGQGQQQALAATLLAQSQGQGPNPAAAMLQQQTAQNIKQNAGLVASQKGINPALAARLAGQNAAQMNQQAAGQGAVMGAQQQLAAQNQLGGLYGNMANQNLANVQNSAGAVNTAVNGTNAINAGVSAQNAAATQATASGLLGGAGSAAMTKLGLAHGGLVPHFAGGGAVSPAAAQIAAQMMAQAGVPTWATGTSLDLHSRAKPVTPVTSVSNSDVYQNVQNPLGVGEAPAQPSMLGVGTLDGSQPAQPSMLGVGKFAQGGLAQGGGPVGGKARVKGDSSKNDTVPAMLSPGEIVIPRSIANDPEKAKEFIKHLNKQKKGKDEGGFGKVLEAHRKLGETLKAMGAK